MIQKTEKSMEKIPPETQFRHKEHCRLHSLPKLEKVGEICNALKNNRLTMKGTTIMKLKVESQGLMSKLRDESLTIGGQEKMRS